MPQTFDGPIWNDDGPTPEAPVGVQLSSLLDAALRIAGITRLPGITPSGDQYGELIPVLNRMMSSYSLDGHRIYTSSIDQYPLVSGQTQYTIGPGGDFDNPRPIFIAAATIMFPTDPVVRYPMRIILDPKLWMSITVQEISGAPPNLLYYDGAMSSAGLANIYIWYQPPDGYTLELATWLALKSDFTAPSDTAVLPPGYEEMITWNLALKCAGMYPLESILSKGPQAVIDNMREQARASLQAVITMNSKCPPLRNEAAFINRRNRGGMSYGIWLAPGG